MVKPKVISIAVGLALGLWGTSMAMAADTPVTHTFQWSSERVITSAFSSSGNKETAESTLYFNDGFGRLTEFHMNLEDHRMELVIRQNMNVVWQGSRMVENSHFSVTRETTMGQVSFTILMGDKTYEARINDKDQWVVTEKDLVTSDWGLVARS